MTPTKANAIARAANVDGLAQPDLVRLSELGSGGRHKEHMWRDLKVHMKEPKLQKALAVLRVPLKGNGARLEAGEIGMLYPHMVFSLLYEKYPEKFKKYILGGDAANVTKFWDEMTDHPSFAGHPMLTHAFFDYKTKAVPIIIYGDGTLVTGISKGWSKSVDSLIWSSALATKGNTWLHNFIICFLYALNMYVDGDGKHLTEDDIWRELVWSLYWLHEGVHPDRGSDNIKYTAGEAYAKKGQPLAGGYFGPTWVITADLEFLYKRLFFC